MSERDVVAWALVGLAVLDVIVTAVLVRAARRLNEPALQERATVSVVLTVGGVALAAMGAAYLADVTIPPPLTFWLLVAVFVIVSVPQLIWYAVYRTGGLK